MQLHQLAPLDLVDGKAKFYKVLDDAFKDMFRDPMFQTRAHEDNLQAHYPWRIIPVEQNDILIFPGWLEHKTEPSKAIGRRICLTLNYNFKPMGVKK